MNYSRKQLEAFGEPLGDSVTRKEGGRIIYGGGGSSSPPATQTQIADLPSWAKPSAQKVLARGEALTERGYTPYRDERIAGFTPMQEQAFGAASQLAPSQAGQAGIGVAGEAAQRALGMQYNPTQATYLQARAPQLQQFQMGPAARVRADMFGGDAAEHYMSPYIEQAMAPQLREAQRSSEMMRNQNQAQAVQQGAFGGSRQAIVEAERQRNLGMQMGDIRVRGLQAAYEQAQNQFNQDAQRRMQAQLANQQAGLTVGGQNLQALLGTQQLGAQTGLQAQLANQQAFQQAQQLGEQSRQYGAGLGLQGLQTALQGAGQLGALGGQEFGQQKDIIGLQSQMGAQQQGLEQQRLSQQYQDFLNQQKFPYQQLEFMSNLLRGTPMGTVNTLYGAQPTAAQNIASLGMGAYGLSKMFAEGGSVTDADNVESILDKLSDTQLQQAKQMALTQRDQEKVAMIDAELAQRASIRSGLGGAFNAIPEERQEQMMAGGGIVAFAGDEDENENQTGQLVGGLAALMAPSEGNPAAYRQVTSAFPQLLQLVAGAKPTRMTDEEYEAAREKALAQYQKIAGPSPYEGLSKQIGEMREEGAKGLEQAKGLAALKAAAAMQQGRGFIRGLTQAGGAFGESYGQALQADKAQKRSLMNMEIQMADARRKENLGLYKEAEAAAERARKSKEEAGKFALQKANALANVAGKFAAATKPTKAAGSGEKPPKINEQLAAAEVAFENDPSEANKKRVTALRRAVTQVRTSDIGPTRAGVDTFRTTATASVNEQKLVNTRRFTDPDWMAAYEKSDPAGMAAAEDAILARIRASGPGTPGAGAPVNSNLAPAPKAGKVEGLPPGATVRGNEVYDANGKLIGHIR